MNIPLPLVRLWQKLGDVLMRNSLLVLASSLLLLALVVVFSGKKSQDVREVATQAVSEGQLSKKQVKKAEKALAATQDTIKKQAAIIHIATHKADSLAVVAKKHDARADSLVKRLTHEVPTDPTDTPERISQLLTDYTPKAWAVGADSLR
jgi:hypothetical protein